MTSNRRSGWLVPVFGGVKRTNLIILANANFPPPLWADPAFREALGVGADGAFPVRLWLIRGGIAQKVLTIVRVPAHQTGSAQINGLAHRYGLVTGDVVAVESTLGLLVWPCERGVCGPVVSIVEGVTNDPVAYLPTATR